MEGEKQYGSLHLFLKDCLRLDEQAIVTWTGLSKRGNMDVTRTDRGYIRYDTFPLKKLRQIVDEQQIVSIVVRVFDKKDVVDGIPMKRLYSAIWRSGCDIIKIPADISKSSHVSENGSEEYRVLYL